MKSFKKIVTLTVLFLTVSFASAYGQNMGQGSFNQILELAKQGDAQAQTAVGGLLFLNAKEAEDKDYEQANKSYTIAVSWFRAAAQQNEPTAQFMLGQCYQEGNGVSKDLNEAIKWYKQAAENGNPAAQLRLGFCYSTGTGVTKDGKEAVKWFFRSAQQNNPEAQYWVGVCYENGVGVSQNYDTAYEWYVKAMNRYQPAYEAANRMYNDMMRRLDYETDMEVINIINSNRPYYDPYYTPYPYNY